MARFSRRTRALEAAEDANNQQASASSFNQSQILADGDNQTQQSHIPGPVHGGGSDPQTSHAPGAVPPSSDLPNYHQQHIQAGQNPGISASVLNDSHSALPPRRSSSRLTTSAPAPIPATRSREIHYEDDEEQDQSSTDWESEDNDSDYDSGGRGGRKASGRARGRPRRDTASASKTSRTKRDERYIPSMREPAPARPIRSSSRLQQTGSAPRYVDDDDEEEEDDEVFRQQQQPQQPYEPTGSRRSVRNAGLYSSQIETQPAPVPVNQTQLQHNNNISRYQTRERGNTDDGTNQHSQQQQPNSAPHMANLNQNSNFASNISYNSSSRQLNQHSLPQVSGSSDSDDSGSDIAFGDHSIDSDEYDEYIELLRQRNKPSAVDSDDEQMIFKRINPAEFSAYPTVAPSTVNLLSEAVHGVLTATNKEQTLHDLASKLADLDSDPFLSAGPDGTGPQPDGAEATTNLSPRDLQNQAILSGWGHVGGHKAHLQVLHEMIILPLLFPEIFQTFNISPPRGVLFTGPPGTGKTLTARTLATIVQNISGKKVSFFVRKGADCLSKWVGEAERQLRLLFDQAKAMQPSIIFFDEIDGLVPIRNSNQDHIHSSIVSTLLALMDGLDGRGEQVIVIGATNRVDSIDPALRRPGRFDRELHFSLPNATERLDILKIHTKQWSKDGTAGSNTITPQTPRTTPEILLPLLTSVSHITAGYSGADLQSLCTQASLCCLRRSLPHLYNAHGTGSTSTSTSSFMTQIGTNPGQMTKLLESIAVTHEDFVTAMKSITPTQQRVFSKASLPLNQTLKLIYDNTKQALTSNLQKAFVQYQLLSPPSTATTTSTSATGTSPALSPAVELSCECCTLCRPIVQPNSIQPPSLLSTSTNLVQPQQPTLAAQLRQYMHTLLPLPQTDTTNTGTTSSSSIQPNTTPDTFTLGSSSIPTTYQNKLMLINRSNLGQHALTQSLLVEYEEIPIYTLSLSSLHNLQHNYGTTTLYDTILTLFTNIKRDHFQSGFNTKYPSCIIHWPNIHQWYEYSYLNELIELVLLSLSECAHLINNSIPASAHGQTQNGFNGLSGVGGAGASAGQADIRGYLLLCDAQWDYFQIPEEITSLFNHTSAQGVIIDVSHNQFHNLLSYPHVMFPQDTFGSRKKTGQASTAVAAEERPQQFNLFSLFDTANANAGMTKDEIPLTSNCGCTCSSKTQKRLSTILTTVLEQFMKQYISFHASESHAPLFNTSPGEEDLLDQPRKKQSLHSTNDDHSLVQLPPPTTTTTATTTSTAKTPKSTSIPQAQINADFSLDEVDLNNPDKVYFSMREQRYREIILLHLRMFLRNVHSHLLAHFKDFVITRDDFPPLPTSDGTFSDDYGLTLTEILTRVNTSDYLSIREYLCDIDLLVAQTKIRFNLATDVGSIMIQRVCAMQDVALTLCLGFDLQIAAACELIAKELRLKQQYLYTQMMNLHYGNPKQHPAVLVDSVKLFGHVFQHDSLLMVSDLRKHVQTYIAQRQNKRLLQLQQQKLASLNPAVVIAPQTPVKNTEASASTSMDDGDNATGTSPLSVQSAKKRPLAALSEPTGAPSITVDRGQPQSQPQPPSSTTSSAVSSIPSGVPSQPMLFKIHLLIEQLGVFAPTIDIPTIESLHQQLLQCLFSTPFKSSSDLYEQAQTRILEVLNRFLTFCRKNDELDFELFFTPQWLKLCSEQAANP